MSFFEKAMCEIMGRGMAKKKKMKRASRKGAKLYAAVIVAVALVGAVVLVRHIRAGAGVEVAGNFFKGAADAAIVLEEFSDFR